MATMFDSILGWTSEGDVWAVSLPNVRGQGAAPTRHVASQDAARLERFCKKRDVPGAGCFYCVATIEEGKERKKEHARQLAQLHVDVDFKDHDAAPADIEGALRGAALHPTRIHGSGGGLHGIWKVEVPFDLPEDMAKAEDLLRRLCAHFGGDPSVAHVVALLRVPGTHNSKRAQDGEQGTLVTVLHEGLQSYPYEELDAWLAPGLEPVLVRRGNQQNPFSRHGESSQTFKTPVDPEQRLADMVHGGEGESSVHATQLSVTASLMSRGVDVEEATEMVLAATMELPEAEGWNDRVEKRKIRNMCTDFLRKHPRDEQAEPVSLADATAMKGKGDNLPVVQIHAGELPEVAKRAEELLIASKVAMYQRGGMLVRPVIETTDASHGRKTKVARLVQIVPVYLRNKLGQIAQWQRYDKRGKKYLPVDVPTDVAPIILASEGEWAFPAISGVITTPTMRPDGTILDKAGYDEATRLLLIEPPPMPPIPDAPTIEQARAALALLEGLLREFPLVDDVAKAVALSALITPVVRGAFAVAPMHVTRAPVASSGKSYLNDIVSSISIGQPMPVMAAGRTEEETEKRLGAALLTGQPLISIDNVNGELGGDFLCQAIERPVVEVRILGKSEKVRIEARGTTLFGTGNNIIMVGDVCRRVITAALNPNMERPELREFTGNPVRDVMENRGAYIAAALTVCRAYVVAGRPNAAKRLASFEGWSDTVRSALMWLGKADAIDSMEIARADDPERSELADVLKAWGDTIGVGYAYRTTLSDLITISEERLPSGTGYDWPELNAAVSAVCRGRTRDQNAARVLGLWARGKKDRIVDGMSLARSRTSNSNNAKTYWWVEGEERPGAWHVPDRNAAGHAAAASNGIRNLGDRG